MHTWPRLSLKDACSWWVMTPAGGCALPVGVICSPPSLHTHSCVCCEDAVPLPPSLPSPLDQDERENCKTQILRYVSGYTRWDMCQLSVFTEVFLFLLSPPPPILSSYSYQPSHGLLNVSVVTGWFSDVLHHFITVKWVSSWSMWFSTNHITWIRSCDLQVNQISWIMWSSTNQNSNHTP